MFYGGCLRAQSTHPKVANHVVVVPFLCPRPRSGPHNAEIVNSEMDNAEKCGRVTRSQTRERAQRLQLANLDFVPSHPPGVLRYTRGATGIAQARGLAVAEETSFSEDDPIPVLQCPLVIPLGKLRSVNVDAGIWQRRRVQQCTCAWRHPKSWQNAAFRVTSRCMSVEQLKSAMPISAHLHMPSVERRHRLGTQWCSGVASCPPP
jgi:hypothetical protein